MIASWDVDRFVSFDLETHLIQEGLLAPPIVCGSIAWLHGGGAVGRLLHPAEDAYATARRLLASDRIVVGANVAYDMTVLAAEAERRGDAEMQELIVRAYMGCRVFDVLVASALEAIADGTLERYPTWDPRAWTSLKKPGGKVTRRFSLEVCADIVLGRTDAKRNDYWKKRYAVLERVPLADWPEEARQYPVDDAVNTLDVALVQRLGSGGGWAGTTICAPERHDRQYVPSHRNLEDMADQAETAFWEQAGAAWGLRTDPRRVEELGRRAAEVRGRVDEWFARHGLMHSGSPCRCGALKCDRGGRVWEQAVKRRLAEAHGASASCAVCGGGGRVLSASGGAVFCERCDGCGLDLALAEGLPRTPTGAISTKRDALMESGDEVLAHLGDNAVVKIEETYLPYVRRGIPRPLTLSPNVLLASGRSSYDELIQLFPRQPLMDDRTRKPYEFGGLPLGVRQCVRARDGYVLCSVDYSAIELCCLAQVCLWLFGRSRMAEVINETRDPGFLHSVTAARMIGITDEEMRARLKAKDKQAKDFRQAAKPFSFGVPGGMGGAKIVLTNRQASAGETVGPDGTRYAGIRFCILVGGEARCGATKVTEWKRRSIPPTCRRCLEVAEYQLRPTFLGAYPEVREYLAWSNGQVESGVSDVPCFVPTAVRAAGYTRMRGGVDYTSRANNGFQALNGDGTKASLRAVSRDMWGLGPMGRESPLFGSHVMMILHDELLSELLKSRAHPAAHRKSKIMVDTMKMYLPDVYVEAKPAIARWWSKEMEAREEGGILVPWDLEAIEEERQFCLTAARVAA